MYEQYPSPSLHLHEFVSHAVISGRHYPINYRFTLNITGVISLIGIIVSIKVYSKLLCSEHVILSSYKRNPRYHSAKIIYRRISNIKLHI